jgi:hypothetical protein
MHEPLIAAATERKTPPAPPGAAHKLKLNPFDRSRSLTEPFQLCTTNGLCLCSPHWQGLKTFRPTRQPMDTQAVDMMQ